MDQSSTILNAPVPPRVSSRPWLPVAVFLGGEALAWLIFQRRDESPAWQIWGYSLFLGWWTSTLLTIPLLSKSLYGVALCVVCGSGLLAGGHVSLAWCVREWSNSQTTFPHIPGSPTAGEPATSHRLATLHPWQFRWTASGLGLLLLMFFAGMALIGIIHEAVWILRLLRGDVIP